MASKAVCDAVKARLAASFAVCPVYEVNNQLEGPADGAAYVQVQYPIGPREQASIGAPGSNVIREEGAIRFVIFTPIGTGLEPIHTIADALTALFQNARFANVRCDVPTTPVIDDGNDRAGWFVASIAVAYEYDTFA